MSDLNCYSSSQSLRVTGLHHILDNDALPYPTTGIVAVPLARLGIVIRPHEVGLTCPGVLPILQRTFPYGDQPVSLRVGHTIR